MMKTDMKNLNNRLEKLEATNTPPAPLEWTPQEKKFRNEIHNRMREVDTTFYCDVCTPGELEKMRIQSTKASLMYYRQVNGYESN